MLKVLIADDNDGMRLILKKAVEKEGHEVVAEAKNGEEAVEFAIEKKPDMIFMDIEMPKVDGVEAAKRIQDIDPQIAIVFATAHEEYREEAFEIYAYDYLTKPFSIDRIYNTLERFDKQKKSQVQELTKDSIVDNSRKIEKLLLRQKEGVALVKTEEIILAQRENRSTAIYTTNNKYITNETLSELEQRLPSPPFFRAHKSYVINADLITKIYPYGRWTYIVKFEGSDIDALMTHERYGLLQKFFS